MQNEFSRTLIYETIRSIKTRLGTHEISSRIRSTIRSSQLKNRRVGRGTRRKHKSKKQFKY